MIALSGKFRISLSITIFVSALVLLIFGQAQSKASPKPEHAPNPELKIALEDISRTLPNRMSAAQKRQYMINYLLDLELTAKQAERENLHKSQNFKQKMKYFRKKALMEAFMDKVRAEAVSDDKVVATYKRASKRHKPEAQVRAKHILVKDKVTAEKALERIKKGEDFAKVARQMSKDPGSPGGDLGWFSKDRMVPAFAEVAFNTKVGEVSAPVKSQFGWHIIKVEGKRKSQFPPLDKVRPQIEKFLIRQAQVKAIKALRENKLKKTQPDDNKPASSVK